MDFRFHFFPWWSDPGLTMRFMRPLSSVLLWVDHWLFADAPLPQHLHSFLWWVAVVVAARALFQRSFSSRIATMATVIFALAPCHAIPLAWLANREALVSLTFGIVGMLAIVRVREAGKVSDALIASVCFALSFLAGEYAISLAGFVLAHEVMKKGTPQRRALTLLPFVLPAALYLGARSLRGYGSSGSGFYTDPLHDPLAFALGAPRRAAILLIDAWLGLDQDTVTVSSSPWWVVLIAVVLAALFVLPIRESIKALPEAEPSTARWFLLGGCLALVPVLAVVPSPRLLGASMLGFSPVIAIVLNHAWFPTAPPSRRGLHEWTALAAMVLAFAHFVHGPGVSFLMGRSFYQSTWAYADAVDQLRARIGDVSESEVVAMRVTGGGFFLPFSVDATGRPPAYFRILSHASHVLALRRGPRTLELLGTEAHGLYPAGEGNLFLDAHHRVEVGQVFEVPGMTATVLEILPDGRPRSARFEFARDLEDAQWLHEAASGFPDATPPEPGFGTPFDP